SHPPLIPPFPTRRSSDLAPVLRIRKQYPPRRPSLSRMRGRERRARTGKVGVLRQDDSLRRGGTLMSQQPPDSGPGNSPPTLPPRSEEHTSELQSPDQLVR